MSEMRSRREAPARLTLVARLVKARQLLTSYFHEVKSIRRTLVFLLRLLCLGVRRRVVARVATRAASAIRSEARSPKGEPLPIAVRLSGGIGDCLVIARFLRDLAERVEPVAFDIFSDHRSAAQWAMAVLPNCRDVYEAALWPKAKNSYRVALFASQFVVVENADTPPSIAYDYPRLTKVLGVIEKSSSKLKVVIDRHPYMDGFLGRSAVYQNSTRANFLHAMAGIPYSGPRLPLLLDESIVERLALRSMPYVTINNGFDVGFIMGGGSSTKSYPHCAELVRLLKARYPDIAVVQLGASSSTSIAGIDINLVGETSLAQAAAVMNSALLHIDNEGGLVHLASCLGVLCCVVFGPTSTDYFAYPDNINVRPQFCGGCWWTNMTWMERCPRGFEHARCMYDQHPGAVLDALCVRLDSAIAERLGRAESRSKLNLGESG